jgi:hypothetical protein
MHTFQNFFFQKNFLADKLANAKKMLWLTLLYRKIGPKMTFDHEDSGELDGKDFLKNVNLLYLSYSIITIFAIKVCFLANTGTILNGIF